MDKDDKVFILFSETSRYSIARLNFQVAANTVGDLIQLAKHELDMEDCSLEIARA